MVTAQDIGKQIAYVVNGETVALGRMTGFIRDNRWGNHWAEIAETVGDNIKRRDEYRADLCEVVP